MTSGAHLPATAICKEIAAVADVLEHAHAPAPGRHLPSGGAP